MNKYIVRFVTLNFFIEQKVMHKHEPFRTHQLEHLLAVTSQKNALIFY